jgi:predicted site-specific integrase-resolvase
MKPETKWITRREAAERAGRTMQTIDNWRWSNKLPWRKDKLGHITIHTDDLERILNQKEGTK